ncbi:MAG: hypothetical protein ACP5Q1_04290 [Anaerolineae bacterium]
MDKRLVERVLRIEQDANMIRERAARQAERLLQKAEQRARLLRDKAHAEAEEEARRLIAAAQNPEECAQILAQAEEEAKRVEELAMTRFEQAVSYVLDQIVGKE